MPSGPFEPERRPPWLAVSTALLSVFLLVLSVGGVTSGWNSRYTEAWVTQHEFDQASNRVQYLDEVLSSSVMIFAATGDSLWLDRYHAHVEELDREIARVQSLSAQLLGRVFGRETQIANEALVAIELSAIAAAERGESERALSLLRSSEYARQKQIYALGNARANEALDEAIRSADRSQDEALRSLTLVSFLLGIVSVIALAIVVSSFRRYVQAQRGYRTSLSRQRSELKAIIDAIPGMIYFKDGENTILDLNRAAADAIGLPAREIRGRKSEEFFPAEDAAAYLEDDREVFRGKRPKLGIREIHEPKDGERLHIQTDKIPLIGPTGELDRLVAVVTDITELTKAQAAAESASRAKGEFLANMSHEIRTPMTAILGYAEILRDDSILSDDPNRARQVIESIHDNAQHLLVLINDILDVSKIEARRLTVEKVPTEVATTVHEVIELLLPQARGKGIGLEAEFLGAIPLKIESDPVRFRQILLNLVGNATKFTEQGEVRVSVRCRSNPGTLEVMVSDTGIGMTEAQCRQIAEFDAFSQADASTTRRFGGTGLGLSISRSLANLLGGDIRVESEWRKGSTFTLTIATGDLDGVPLVDGASLRRSGPARPSRVERKRQKAKRLEGLHVLLAEDGPDNQKLVTYFLEKAGARVTLAENGRIACEILEELSVEEQPQVILMDMQMPELDGYSATRRLRGEGIRTPIFALTAHAMDGDRAKCLEAGCSGFLTKPVDREKLIEACLDAVGSPLEA